MKPIKELLAEHAEHLAILRGYNPEDEYFSDGVMAGHASLSDLLALAVERLDRIADLMCGESIGTEAARTSAEIRRQLEQK
jgi:hypothetical protein